jgi:2-C-methyl-D-erythritol 4-phosphate cytidylyltransferase/2-C-methyl-D-erythritol 2,4-cyclodiphosphate synthase
MIEYSLQAFRACAAVNEIVIICPLQQVERARQLVAGGPADKTEKVVAGGETRQQSVRNGLREVRADTDIVVVHDAARPFVSVDLIDRCLQAAQEHGAAIAAVPCSDTVKYCRDAKTIAGTVPREGLFLAQTPQAFRCSVLLSALERAEQEGLDASDEAGPVERTGRPVFLVPGSADNIKVTTPADLALAEAIALGRAGPVSTGFGYDVHPFAAGRPLILAGVEFASEMGLAGYSDADVVCHAVCDAVLGCACAGDIGTHFPDTDPAWRGARSLDLLAAAAKMVCARGFSIVHADATLVAEVPRVVPQAQAMRANLAAALGIGPENVSIKATTSEGLGFVGRKEGIACFAVCTAYRVAQAGARDP